MQAEGEGEEQQHAATVARLSALLEERRQQYEFSDITIALEGAGADAQLGAPAIVVACRCGGWRGAGCCAACFRGGRNLRAEGRGQRLHLADSMLHVPPPPALLA